MWSGAAGGIGQINERASRGDVADVAARLMAPYLGIIPGLTQTERAEVNIRWH